MGRPVEQALNLQYNFLLSSGDALQPPLSRLLPAQVALRAGHLPALPHAALQVAAAEVAVLTGMITQIHFTHYVLSGTLSNFCEKYICVSG